MSWEITGVLIALIGLLITTLIEWQKLSTRLRLLGNRFTAQLEKARRWQSSRSRRTFLISTVTGGLLAVGGLGLAWFRNWEADVPWVFSPMTRKRAPLVINSRSGVIHHMVFCAAHLPLPGNRRAPSTLTKTDHFHTSVKVRILEVLAADRPDEEAVQLFLLALEGQPTTMHIYDRLIRILGRLKRYESIYLLLEYAHKTLTASRDTYRPGTRVFRQYAKAVQAIELRQEQARGRARAVAVRS
jgi:hypothetical protein